MRIQPVMNNQSMAVSSPSKTNRSQEHVSFGSAQDAIAQSSRVGITKAFKELLENAKLFEEFKKECQGLIKTATERNVSLKFEGVVPDTIIPESVTSKGVTIPPKTIYGCPYPHLDLDGFRFRLHQATNILQLEDLRRFCQDIETYITRHHR